MRTYTLIIREKDDVRTIPDCISYSCGCVNGKYHVDICTEKMSFTLKYDYVPKFEEVE